MNDKPKDLIGAGDVKVKTGEVSLNLTNVKGAFKGMTERSASKKFLDKNTTLPLTRNNNLEKPAGPMHDKFMNKYEKLRKVDSQSSMTGL